MNEFLFQNEFLFRVLFSVKGQVGMLRLMNLNWAILWSLMVVAVSAEDFSKEDFFKEASCKEIFFREDFLC